MLHPTCYYQRRRTSIEELEASHLPRDIDPDRVRQYPELLKPFGFENERWESMKAQMQASDELWEFCNEIEMWEGPIGFGLAGVELVRGDEVIACIITMMN